MCLLVARSSGSISPGVYGLKGLPILLPNAVARIRKGMPNAVTFGEEAGMVGDQLGGGGAIDPASW